MDNIPYNYKLNIPTWHQCQGDHCRQGGQSYRRREFFDSFSIIIYSEETHICRIERKAHYWKWGMILCVCLFCCDCFEHRQITLIFWIFMSWILCLYSGYWNTALIFWKIGHNSYWRGITLKFSGYLPTSQTINWLMILWVRSKYCAVN